MEGLKSDGYREPMQFLQDRGDMNPRLDSEACCIVKPHLEMVYLLFGEANKTPFQYLCLNGKRQWTMVWVALG